MIKGNIWAGDLRFFHKKRVPISGDPLTTEDTPIQFTLYFKYKYYCFAVNKKVTSEAK